MKYRSPYKTKVMIRTPFLFVPSKGMVISQMFFATYVSKLLLSMSGKVCNRFPRRRSRCAAWSRTYLCVNRPSRKAKVGGKHSWYSSSLGIFLPPPSSCSLNTDVILSTYPTKPLPLRGICPPTSITIVEGHDFLIKLTDLITSRICRNLLGEVFKSTGRT